MKSYVGDVLKAIKGSWRKHITEKEEAAKNGAEEKATANKAEQIKTESKGLDGAQVKPEDEEEEDSLFEKTKLNWLFRQLYIDTAIMAKKQSESEESKE